MNKALAGLRKLNGGLDAAVKFAAPSIVGLIFLFVFTEIMTRAIVRYSFAWMSEFPPLMLTFVAFLLFGALYKSKRHIMVDLVSHRLREKPRKMLSLFINVVMIYGSYLILRGAIELMVSFYVTGFMSFTEFRLPMWIFSTSLVIGAVLLLLCSIELMVTDTLWLISSKKARTE